MVQLTTSPKTPKMAKSKTPKKAGAADTPAKAEVKTPKQAKNTPAKAEVKTPKQAKNTPAKAEVKTPKQAKNTPAKAEVTPAKTASAKKTKKAKTPKQEKPAEDVEMASEGEEEAAPAQPSPKKAKKAKKQAPVVAENSEMNSEEEEITIKSKKAAPKQKEEPKEEVKFGIFIKGLDFNTDQMSVSDYFSQYGPVSKCSVPRNPMKKHLNKGFAFVQYPSQEAVDKALAASHKLDSRMLTVKVNSEQAGKRKRDESQQPGNAAKRQMTNFQNEIFVARLSFSTTKEAIQEHFSQFGEVHSVGLPMAPNSDQQKNKGFAFVAFKDPSAMNKALSQQDQEIDSSNIVVQLRKQPVAQETRPKQSHPNELFVGGVNIQTTRETLMQHFGKYGKIANLTLPFNKIKGVNKGFCFVSFETPEGLQGSLAEDHEIDGKKVGAKASVSSPAAPAETSPVAKKVKAAPAKVEEEEMEAENEESDDEAEGEAVEGEDDDEEEEGEDDEEEDDEEGDDDDEEEGDDDEEEGDDDDEEEDDE